jgi:hypothetical protein
MESIKDGVASGMTPLFMRVNSSVPGITDLARARMISTIEIFNPHTAYIEILSPTPEVFEEHNNGVAIPNDNLMYRSTTEKGGVSVQDANLLKIRVSYCFKLVVPLVNKLIYGMAVGLEETKVLTGISFNDAGSTESKPNMCTNINKVKAEAADSGLLSPAARAAAMAELCSARERAAALAGLSTAAERSELLLHLPLHLLLHPGQSLGLLLGLHQRRRAASPKLGRGACSRELGQLQLPARPGDDVGAVAGAAASVLCSSRVQAAALHKGCEYAAWQLLQGRQVRHAGGG